MSTSKTATGSALREQRGCQLPRPQRDPRVHVRLHKHPHGRAPHRQREDHSSFTHAPAPLLRQGLQPPDVALEGEALRAVRNRRRVPRPPQHVLVDEGAGSNHGRHLSFRREGRESACYSVFLVGATETLPALIAAR